MFAMVVGLAAAGNLTFTPDKDLNFVGASVNAMAAIPAAQQPLMSIGLDIGLGTTWWFQPPTSSPSYGMFMTLGPSSYGVFPQNQKIPVKRGVPIYVAFSTGAWGLLYFEDPMAS